ncbi:MAG: gfo/Idh/MocA family oxidoreductase, partial [Pseudomonadota bacterium]
RDGKKPDEAVTYPTIEDGLKGVQFIDACVRSSARNAAWVKL